jgi:hypothetical protein
VRPTGKVSLGGLVLALAVVGGLWAAVLFLPVYADNMDVQKAVREAWLASRKQSDEWLIGSLNAKLRHVGTHVEDDGFGNEVVKPGLVLTRDQVWVDRNSVTGEVTVQVTYQRDVRLKPLSKVVTLTFQPSMEGVPQ